MGMFDWVTDVPELKCKVCGELITGWQTKGYVCEMTNVPFWEVNSFYTFCKKCGAWYQYNRKEAKQKIDEYDLNITEKES
jgi:transcription elongation factor Elf1